MTDGVTDPSRVMDVGGRRKMLAPLEVQRMLALQARGWGAKRISKELGCSRNTVREYLRSGGWKPMDVSGRKGHSRAAPTVAGTAAAPAQGQCRRGAPGAAARVRHRREPAHRAARRGADASSPARPGVGPRALRDGTRPAVAGGLRQHPRAGRRGADAHLPVRRVTSSALSRLVPALRTDYCPHKAAAARFAASSSP